MGPTENDSELTEQIAERLSESDLRFTAGRRKIVTALRQAGRPLTLPELLDAAPGLAQSTAYRNLSQLEETSVVTRLVHGDEHARFELAEGLVDHHHHLICEQCGIVVDVTFDDRLEGKLDAACRSIAETHGFELADHVIDVFGRCSDCAAA